ncbi:MAG: ferredoxin:protochlorophyllide reductase (ATP-dependent) subunit B, partial [Pseudomonadota bacterium]
DQKRLKVSAQTGRPTCNLLGATALGFRHRDDVKEITGLLTSLGIDVNVCAPLGARVDDIRALAAADFNVVLYPETGESAARWLEKNCGQPYTKTVPIGIGATHEFIEEVCTLANCPSPDRTQSPSNFPWWSKSIDSTYLTGKRVFIFGDATHAIAAARVAAEEFAFEVVGLGCYNREFARDVRAAAKKYDVEPLITDDYLSVEAAIAEAEPELVLGTQMERHIAKRLGLPCAVISSPVHVQDFPARYSPQMGFEGANVLFDSWVHPLVMGLEEHLLGMFRDDFEFHDGAGASHLGGHGAVRADGPVHALAEKSIGSPLSAPHADEPSSQDAVAWARDAEKELRKIPFFVRGKARRNTEAYAAAHALHTITVDTLYEAKAHYGR